jgi:signal peptide peptidase SppA
VNSHYKATIKRDQSLLNYLTQECWLLHEPVLRSMADVLARHLSGERLSADEVRQIVAAARGDEADREDRYELSGDVATIPITGIIAKHASMVNGVSQPQGSSVQRIADDLARAVAEPRARGIVLRIESPGGSIGGLPELAAAIHQADADKPVIAFVDDQADSAAYWLASQARRIVVTQAASVGSIGVYTLLTDYSQQAEARGLRFVLVRGGRYKGVGTPGLPISSADVEPIQARMDALHGVFKAAVASGRGMDAQAVEALADGRSWTGLQAVEIGLADSLGTLADAMDMARQAAGDAKKFPRPAGSRAKADATPTAETTAAAAEAGSADAGGDPNLTTTRPQETVMDEKDKAAKSAEAAKATEAAAAERARCQAVVKVLAGHGDLIEKALADANCDETRAQAMLTPKLQARIGELEKALADANARLDVIAKGGAAPVAQVKAADGDAAGKTMPAAGGEQASTDDGKAASYQARVDALIKAGTAKATAYIQAAKEMTKAHKAWTEAASKS